MNHQLKIAVALSSYNGVKYLSQQIDSILSQDIRVHHDLTLFIRDDGSEDGTVELIESYASSECCVHAEYGSNRGVVGSFYELLASIPKRFDYIALSDQDDVWLPDKLTHAIDRLESLDTQKPQLYCSEYYFCNESLGQPHISNLNRRPLTFTGLLYENTTSGNTMVLNRKLADAVLSAGPKDIYCHDWWIALVASIYSTIQYDSFPCLYYRRLEASVSPTGSSALSLLRHRFKSFFANGELKLITAQLVKLSECYGDDLSESQAAMLDIFLHGGRLKKVLYPERFRQTASGEAALRMLFLLGML